MYAVKSFQAGTRRRRGPSRGAYMYTLYGQGRMQEGQLLVKRSQGGRNETILRVRRSRYPVYFRATKRMCSQVRRTQHFGVFIESNSRTRLDSTFNPRREIKNYKNLKQQ